MKNDYLFIMTPIYGPKSQQFAMKIDDIKGRFCTCDYCGRHVHVTDRYLAINVGEVWYCTNDCKEEDSINETN